MRARLLRWGATDTLKPTIAGKEGQLWIECEVDEPRSLQGRQLVLYLDGRDVTDLLKELRSSAIQTRMTDG